MKTLAHGHGMTVFHEAPATLKRVLHRAKKLAAQGHEPSERPGLGSLAHSGRRRMAPVLALVTSH